MADSVVFVVFVSEDFPGACPSLDFRDAGFA